MMLSKCTSDVPGLVSVRPGTAAKIWCGELLWTLVHYLVLKEVSFCTRSAHHYKNVVSVLEALSWVKLTLN